MTIIKKDIIFFVLIAYTFVSCENDTVVDIKLPEEHPKIVIISLFSPTDSVFRIQVTKSYKISDSISEKSLYNSSVLLYENGLLIDSLKFDTLTNTYRSPYLPKPYKTYSITAFKEGFDTVRAADYLPDKIKLDTVKIVPYAGKNNSVSGGGGFAFGAVSKVTVEFTDPVEEQNYYEIAFTIKGEGSYYGLYTYENIITNQSYYPSLLSIGSKYPNYLLFHDETINGQTVKLDLFYDPPMWWNDAMYISEHVLCIHFRAVTKNYFLYHTSLLQHLYNRQDNILFGMGEPVNAYTNIENGYGIFAGFNEYKKEILIPEIRVE